MFIGLQLGYCFLEVLNGILDIIKLEFTDSILCSFLCICNSFIIGCIFSDCRSSSNSCTCTSRLLIHMLLLTNLGGLRRYVHLRELTRCCPYYIRVHILETRSRVILRRLSVALLLLLLVLTMLLLLGVWLHEILMLSVDLRSLVVLLLIMVELLLVVHIDMTITVRLFKLLIHTS